MILSFLQNRNLPQNYTILGFIYAELYRRTEDGGENFLTNAEECFQLALDECSEENSGYLAVIYGNLIYLNEKFKNDDASRFIKEYEKISQRVDLENHAEVLAMKGFTASFFHLHEESINFYQKALTLNKTAQWIFGLALVKMRRTVGRTDKTAERNEIEILLRQAMDLDPSYDMIKLKLARLLCDRMHENGIIEEIKSFIDQLQKCKSKDEVNFMEEIALLFGNLDDEERAIKILEKCYKLRPNSPTTLRRLGNMFYEKWKHDKREEHLQKAIKYFTENASNDSQNALPFDVTKIGKVHLDATQFFLSQEKIDEAKYHEQKCKEWFKIAEERLIKEWYDLRNDTETCFELSKFHKHFENLAKEKHYLKETLLKANEGSKTDNFQELNCFKDAKYRLLELFENDFIELSWVYEKTGDFGKAISSLKDKMLLTRDKIPDDLLEKESYLRWQFLKSQIRSKPDDIVFIQITLHDFSKKIEKLHDCATKWDLENRMRKMEVEILMSNDTKLNDLKKAVLQFGESLFAYRMGEAEIKESIDHIFHVLHEGKIILDHSVMYIKEKLYSEKGKASFNYPRAEQMKDKGADGRKDQLEKYYTTNRWADFTQRCPEIAHFLFERLDVSKYDFLLGFFDVRNVAAHKLKAEQIEKLKDYFPTLTDQIGLVYKVSHYVVEVFKFITTEVDRTLLKELKTEEE